MRDHLGHDARFDRVYYSCEIGAAKPERKFFHHILDDLGLPAAAVGFVDDSAANVQAALDVGLHAVRHDPASGVQTLRDEVWALLTTAT
jgi:putative hydrolase of the HAD superfamily